MPRIIVTILLLWSTAALGAPADPIRVGLSMSLTGMQAPVGQLQAQAFRMWAARVNREGGLLGRPVQLTIHDDASDASTARRLYHQMIAEDMDLLLSPYSSGIMAAILPVTEQHGYPMLASGAGADSLFSRGYRYLFGIFPPASIYSLGFLEMVLTSGMERIAIASSSEPFGINIAEGAARWARRLGLKVVSHQVLAAGDARMDSVARAIVAARPDAVLMCGHFEHAVDMRVAFGRIGWQPRAFWASAGPDLQKFREVLGPAADGTFSSTQWQHQESLPYPGSREFFREFVATYGTEPSYHAATAYAAATLLQAAVQQAGNLDRERIRSILSTMDTMTLLGRYGVDRTGMQIRYFHLVTQWLNGRKEIVWPLELRTASPVFR